MEVFFFPSYWGEVRVKCNSYSRLLILYFAFERCCLFAFVDSLFAFVDTLFAFTKKRAFRVGMPSSLLTKEY